MRLLAMRVLFGEIDAKSITQWIVLTKGIIFGMPAFYGFLVKRPKEFKNARNMQKSRAAFGYLMQYFDDGIHGGVVGSSDYQGQLY